VLSVIELAKKYAKDPELAYRVGRQLWGGDFLLLVASRLEGVASLKTGAPEVMLASTVPTDAVRAQLYEVLKKNWNEGPKALEAAGFGGAVVSEPGFLAVIKALPRKDLEPEKVTALQRYRRERAAGGQGTEGSGAPGQPGQDQKKAKGAKKGRGGQAGAAEAGAAAAGQPGSGPPMPGQPTPGAGAPGQPGTTQQAGQGPEFQWMDASESLARAMCEQFAAAAKAAAGKGATVDEESRPLEIPASANVVAEYHFDWPTSIARPTGLSGVSPDAMTIHYVRLEQKTSPRKVFSYFRNRIIRPDEHPVATGFWMESFRPVPKTDRQLSVDILVTKKEDTLKDQAGAAGTAAAPGGAPGMSPAPGAGPGGSPPGTTAPGSPGFGQQQPGQTSALRERAEREKEEGDLVVEILTVMVKSPAPIVDRTAAEETEEAAPDKEKPTTKPKSKVTTIE
jgi:hypothetical protein